MSLPTFNGFDFNDSNFITERVVFKGLAQRSIIRAKINRREGIKLLGNEFGEKEITLGGIAIASSASELQSLLDNMKKLLTAEEGDLVIETGRTFKATVENMGIPDSHYNQTRAPWEVTFVCSDPFAEGSLLTVTIPLVSGTFTISGTVSISGSLFSRPTITITPTGASSGNTNIKKMDVYHVQSGQTITLSGFGNAGGLDYQDAVTINFDNFTTLEGTDELNQSGAFPRWEPGTNQFTITVSGRWTGGNLQLSYRPRYL